MQVAGDKRFVRGKGELKCRSSMPWGCHVAALIVLIILQVQGRRRYWCSKLHGKEQNFAKQGLVCCFSVNLACTPDSIRDKICLG